MQIGAFNISYISHVSFLFQSPRGTVILTDPLFAKGFQWQGHFETYLSPPNVSAEYIKQCDAIFISHIHGDHCDHEVIKNIHERTKACIFAPDDVLESLKDFGIPEGYMSHIDDNVEVDINDVQLLPLSGYDNSFDEKGRPNKFAAIIKTEDTKLFYSGDCHSVPPGLKGQEVYAIFLWPHPDDEKLIQFRDNVSFEKFILMHGDRFDPGDFMCNLNYSEEKGRIQKLMPNIEVIIPERVSNID
jgi:L-ascorbate metabolism protein UlaG (beta-lactamase superfamily)